MPEVHSKRRARQSASRHLGNEEKHQNESEGQSCGNTRANLSTGISYRRHFRKASLSGSIFVNPPKILKRQLTGYCTLPASSPIGRDNKHSWYEEHEKSVAIAARSLSPILVGDSLVNGLARYHRVWSKYF